MKSTVTDYSVARATIDSPHTNLYQDFPNSDEYLGYYKKIPELKKAIDALAIWTVGKGYSCGAYDRVRLASFTGYGEDTFVSILWNMIVQKKVLGDAFAEIVYVDDVLTNIKPLYTGDMRIYFTKNGIIEKYEHRGKDGKVTSYKPEEIFHISNDRIANEMHGTSVIEACKWVIDARNEALADTRKIMHRDLALGILEVDTDKPSQLSSLKDTYATAVKNGEVLVLPKGVAELKDSPVRNHQDRMQFISYLEGFFYQAVGIPRVIASSQEYSEASSKVGYLTFEPIYTFEQTLLEADIWNQLNIKITFNRPPSLSSTMQESEQKNTGQTGFQENEVSVSPTRNE
jgi:hypothetical protein